MTAREEFNHMLNSCYDPIRMFNVLGALVSHPHVKKTDDMREKRAVFLGESLDIIDKASLNETIEQTV